jgi:hypothetical protein
MKTRLVMLTLAAAIGIPTAFALAASGGLSSTAVEQSGFLTLPPAAPAGEMALYGHIKALNRVGRRYELRFDPAWFTSGLTASRAALADTGSSDVPNDNYVIEAGHRLLTYKVAPSAEITVLTNDGSGISATSIKLRELVRIVNGGPHRKLFEPLRSGVWIRVRIDTIREVDQQYQP